MNLIQEFRERELLAQCTNLELLEKWMGEKKLTFYIGFDPTASSLHIGHFMQMKNMKRLQDAGHYAIALFGGGTAMIGDPSGKTDMRPMLTNEEVASHIANFKIQMSKYIDVSEGKALFVNNADWLCDIKYIDMLREVGANFSVNRMLAAECFKSRFEKGLSFLEFNYMIMQGYDFYKLYKDHGCTLQCGGDDQWSNIIAGVDLIRRKTLSDVPSASSVSQDDKAIGLTFALLPGADGTKMGKTSGNAVWLDPNLTSPYDFYQVWRNTDDSLVVKYLKMMTYVPIGEINEMEASFGDAKNINAAKERLAYELTTMIHGEDEAVKAQTAAKSLFYGSADSANMPTTTLTDENFADDSATVTIVDLLVIGGLAKSKREARQLIEQGGVLLDDVKVADISHSLTREQISASVVIKKGKKAFMKFVI